jgi:hypothetical protein
VKSKKRKENVLTENEFFDVTDLDETARLRYEEEGWLKPEISSDGLKFYSPEDAELGKELGRAVKKYKDMGLAISDVHELVVEGMISKARSKTEADADRKGTINPKKIQMHPTFKSLLPIDEDLLKRITADMAANGYDEAKPVVLATWPGQKARVLIDGHTRVRGSNDSGIRQIPYVCRKFDSEAAAVEHAMGLQTKRRISGDDVLFRLIKTYDMLYERGGDRRSNQAKPMPTSVGVEKGRSASAKRTGLKAGCHYKKVEKVRRILRDGPISMHNAVANGKMTINKAYNTVLEEGKIEKKSSGEQDKPFMVHLTEENLADLKQLNKTVHFHVNKAVRMYIKGLRKMGRFPEKKEQE